jgi:hypothetical protein
MNSDEKFPIDPLPDAAWKRIERGVFERVEGARSAAAAQQRVSPSGRRGWALLAAAAVLLAAGGGAFWSNWSRYARTPTPARLASTRIATDRSFTETLLDDVSIRLEAASALVVVEHSDSGALVLLERGQARFSVPPRKQRPPFVVQAGGVRVEVVGTRFRVLHEGPLVQVEDEEGRVRVLAAGQSRLLMPGESFSNALTTVDRASSPAALPQPESAATIDELPAPREPSPTIRSAGASGPAGRVLRVRPAARFEHAAPAPAPLSQAERFERATLVEASDPEAAQRGYASLVADGGRWGETALFALARLKLERGDRAEAQRLLSRYLSQYPQGTNAADVRHLLAELSRQSAPESK